jgi:hypothetical protein
MLPHHPLTECEIHQILSNDRRRAVLDHLGSTRGPVGVRALSETVAAEETGGGTPPTGVRNSVYTALHQTHLPKLHDLGVVHYDRDRSEVWLLGRSRAVDCYAEAVTRFGVSWAGYYRALGVLGLTLVVAALAEVPLLSLVDPLLWASGVLVIFALSTVSQLWADRWRLVRAVRPPAAAVTDGGHDGPPERS